MLRTSHAFTLDLQDCNCGTEWADGSGRTEGFLLPDGDLPQHELTRVEITRSAKG